MQGGTQEPRPAVSAPQEGTKPGTWRSPHPGHPITRSVRTFVTWGGAGDEWLLGQSTGGGAPGAAASILASSSSPYPNSVLGTQEGLDKCLLITEPQVWAASPS